MRHQFRFAHKDPRVGELAADGLESVVAHIGDAEDVDVGVGVESILNGGVKALGKVFVVLLHL